MKTNITISVDVNNLLSAKNKVDNISDYLNQCLKSLSESMDADDVDAEQELVRLNNTIQEAKIKRDILNMELERRKELESQRIASREHLKRWVCPVDATKNLMDNKRCSNCNLSIRDDPKTTFVYEEVSK